MVLAGPGGMSEMAMQPGEGPVGRPAGCDRRLGEGGRASVCTYDVSGGQTGMTQEVMGAVQAPFDHPPRDLMQLI